MKSARLILTLALLAAPLVAEADQAPRIPRSGVMYCVPGPIAGVAQKVDVMLSLTCDPEFHIEAYDDVEACERARIERLSAALRVAKSTDADPEAAVTAQAWQRALAVSAARCVPQP
jgi:hypothetical protein